MSSTDKCKVRIDSVSVISSQSIKEQRESALKFNFGGINTRTEASLQFLPFQIFNSLLTAKLRSAGSSLEIMATRRFLL